MSTYDECIQRARSQKVRIEALEETLRGFELTSQELQRQLCAASRAERYQNSNFLDFETFSSLCWRDNNNIQQRINRNNEFIKSYTEMIDSAQQLADWYLHRSVDIKEKQNPKLFVPTLNILGFQYDRTTRGALESIATSFAIFLAAPLAFSKGRMAWFKFHHNRHPWNTIFVNLLEPELRYSCIKFNLDYAILKQQNVWLLWKKDALHACVCSIFFFCTIVYNAYYRRWRGYGISDMDLPKEYAPRLALW